MRILYVPYLYGSARIVSHEIITRLSKLNKVVVITPNKSDQNSSGLVESGNLLDDLAVILPLRQVMEGIAIARKFNPDVVISQFHPSDMISYAARMISKSVKKPLIVRSDDIWFVPFKRFSSFSKLIYRLNFGVVKDSRLFLVNSNEHKAIAGRIYHRSRGVVIHPNGVDITRFNPNLTGNETKRKLGLRDNKIVLYIGSAAWYYGLQVIPKAFEVVAKEMKDARLVLIGLSGDPIQKESLLGEIKRRNIQNRTTILPPVPYASVHDFIALSDVCLGTLSSLPVNTGTIPTKVPQYMSCGKPTIVAEGGVSHDLIIHNRTGIAFTGGHRNLANWIVRLLGDESFAEKIGRQARDHVVKNYNWDNLVTQLEELALHVSEEA